MSGSDKSPENALSGILVIDKPVGLTSMDAVAIVRRKASREGARRPKTGHAGTLDPLATGVLVIAVGKATKQLSSFMALDKTYLTEVDLSAFTPTDDLESQLEEVPVASPPTEQDVKQALSRFIGPIMQRPSAHSAVKIDGQRAYERARRGEEVEMPERRVIVHELELLTFEWPIAELRLVCGKGLYVRSLARDLGTALGTGGHLHSLRRTAIGPFTESMACTPEVLPDGIQQSDVMALDEAMALAAAWPVRHQAAEGESD